jgi:hypothetical protein
LHTFAVEKLLDMDTQTYAAESGLAENRGVAWLAYGVS